MSNKIHLIVIIALLVFLSACAPKVVIPQTEQKVPRVTVEEAKSALDSGKAIIVDVRNTEYYAEGHAAGAISIPLGNFEYNIGDLSLDKAQWIITYCT